MDVKIKDISFILNSDKVFFSFSDKQNVLGEIYNENIKDLKAEYKLTAEFEKTLNKEVVLYINFMFLKYGKLFFEEPETNITITKNNKISFKYFQKSAATENSKGQYNLALSYYYGIGIKQNLKLAFKYFTKAAQQKNSKAQYALGTIYLTEKIVQQNFMMAIYYFKQAAKQNHILAIIMLSAMYKFGIGCRIDEKKSEELINKLKI